MKANSSRPDQTKSTNPNLPNHTMIPTKPNLLNQAYRAEPNIQNQTYQSNKNKSIKIEFMTKIGKSKPC